MMGKKCIYLCFCLIILKGEVPIASYTDLLMLNMKTIGFLVIQNLL